VRRRGHAAEGRGFINAMPPPASIGSRGISSGLTGASKQSTSADWKNLDQSESSNANNDAKHKGPAIIEPAAKKKKIVCCVICEEDHFTNQCPLLHGPKPTTQFCGLAGEGLGVFNILVPRKSSVAKLPHKVSATALIKIVEGAVSAELVRSELARMLPVKWDWVVRPHGDNAYIVPFRVPVRSYSVRGELRGIKGDSIEI
jgi:hypothetical protein